MNDVDDDDDLRWIDIFSVYLSWLGVWQHLKYWVYISKRIHGKAIQDTCESTDPLKCQECESKNIYI